jgi:flagellar motor protein MotB
MKFINITKNITSSLLIVTAAGLVVSCAKNKAINTNVITPTAPIYAYSTDSRVAIEKSIAKRQAMSHKLAQQGVSVVLVGEQVKLSIPAYKLFNVGSANLSVAGSKLMGQVSRYIGTYSLVNLFVNTYTGNSVPENLAWALSSRQSQVVADYIQLKKLNIRFIDSSGRGRTSSVTLNKGIVADHENARVELSWSFLPRYK